MPVDRYLFGDWEPDRAPHWMGEDGTRLPLNLLPFGKTWRRAAKAHPFRNNIGLPGGNTAGTEFAHDIVRVGGAAAFTGLGTSANGLYFGGYSSGALGSAGGNRIFRVSQPVLGAGFIQDVTRSSGGGYALGNLWWDFCSYGDFVIATDGLNPVQRLNTATGLFIDHITSTDKPTAFYCATIGSHLVLARMTGPADPLNPIKWWCSQRDSSALFNQTGQGRSIFGYFRPGGGLITGIKGWEDYGIVFREQAALIMEKVSGGTYFAAHQIAAAQAGCIDPASIVQVGNDVYYFSRGGFARIIGGSTYEILPGSQGLRGLPYMRMLEYRDGDSAPAEGSSSTLTQSKIQGAYDPHWNAVCWLMMDVKPSSSSSTRRLPYNLLVYQIDSGRWGYANPIGHFDYPNQEIIGMAGWPVGQQAAHPLDGVAFIGADLFGMGMVGSPVNHYWLSGVEQARYVTGSTHKICRAEGYFWHRNDQAIKILRVRPLYHWASAGVTTAPTIIPNLGIHVRMEPALHRPMAAPNEAFSDFTDSVDIVCDPTKSTNGWHMGGLPVEGQYFAFRLSFPAGSGGYDEVTRPENPILVDVIGVDIDWVPSSKKG